jgi:hypothetical protein
MIDRSFEQRLLDAPREKLLSLLTRLIRELTITARFYASVREGRHGLETVSDAVQRLSGHLRDLQRPKEPMTAGRAAAIAEIARPLIRAERLSHLLSAALD